jgi:superfamily I DNA/RNA helicase
VSGRGILANVHLRAIREPRGGGDRGNAFRAEGDQFNADLEEERRLLYVAMTRAKDSLHLITPHRLFYTQACLER